MDTLQTFTKVAADEGSADMAELDPWFHNIHLPDGRQTAPDHPLGDFPNYKWQKILHYLPNDLTGWRVLDVGCNAGFYSFALAQRGAMVDAVDMDPHYLKQAEWVRGQLKLEKQVKLRQAQVYDIAREPDNSYDLIWFMGVFYHLRYPLLALDILARKTKQMMVFQSLTLNGASNFITPDNLLYRDRQEMDVRDWPRMAFVEKAFAGDPTNWWVPNASAACGVLRAAGMVPVAQPDPETWICTRQQEFNPESAEYDAVFGWAASGAASCQRVF